MVKRVLGLLAGIFVSFLAHADSVTGTIHTLHVNLESGRAHIQFVGLPYFNGGGCSSYWTVNDIADTNFMKFIWPLLLAGKATDTPVTVTVNGCIEAWPQIVAVDLQPRQSGS